MFLGERLLSSQTALRSNCGPSLFCKKPFTRSELHIGKKSVTSLSEVVVINQNAKITLLNRKC